ncbi:hypothetical protein Q9L58_006879 [Maublancomyces gigas]|uniref:F-box domain-containing protein n=1 Tax=Discina gigas TaxID=1032678 RepID=A0ABR3GEB9_9PEZI
MVALAELPTEILREIFSSLKPADLVNASLVSHRLYSITESFLYKTVVLSSATIIPFTRTIIERRDLANHVKDLKCNQSDTTRASHSLMVCLLLHAIPNLHIFTCAQLVEETFHKFTFFETMTGRTSSNAFPVGVQSLQEIECGLDKLSDPYEELGVDCNTLFAMMRFPSIRKIRASMMDDEWEGDVDSYYNAKAGTSSVTHLEIINYVLRPEMIELILKVPQSLTNFSYFDSGYDPSFLVDPTFGIAIGRLQATLQFLELDFSESVIMHEDEVMVVYYPIGMFRDWPQLTRIKSPLLPLLGSPDTPATPRLGAVLPLVVKELSVDTDPMWMDSDIVGQLMDLLEWKEAYGLTRLKVIKISHLLLSSDELRDRLAAACNTAGIEFGVVTYNRIE